MNKTEIISYIFLNIVLVFSIALLWDSSKAELVMGFVIIGILLGTIYVMLDYLSGVEK